MFKITRVKLIGALIGLILIFIGIFGPWISLNSSWTYFNETSKIYGKSYCKMSPFTITFSSNIIAHSPIVHERKVEIIPSNTFLGSGIKHLYDPVASLIGIFCIMGAILDFFGQYIDRWKVAFTGGVLTLLSTISFFICLPKNTNVLYFKVMWHWYLTILGTILLIACATFKFMRNFVQNLVKIFIQLMSWLFWSSTLPAPHPRSGGRSNSKKKRRTPSATLYN